MLDRSRRVFIFHNIIEIEQDVFGKLTLFYFIRRYIITQKKNIKILF